ncbi:MAG: hypothetical protein QXX85_04340 [Candidatus Nitrosotenuis sp.]
MGLSIVLAGGIAGAAMIAVFSIIFTMTAQVYEVNSSRTQSTVLENLIAQTDIEIQHLNATAFDDVVSFTLVNTGNEKIWDYEKFNILVTYTANIGGVPTLTTEHLTYNSALAFGETGNDSSTAKFARPDSDITNNNNWDDPAPGGNNNNILYDEIDEAVQNDADYVTSGPIDLILDTSETLVVGLSDIEDPRTSSNHIVRYTYKKDQAGGNQIDLTVSLLQGGTTIASWSHNNIDQNFVLATQTLTTTQANSITDYTNLRLQFTGTMSGDNIQPRSVQISWAEVEVPPTIYDCSQVPLGSGQWTIDRINNNLHDPRILNTDEDGKFCIKLTNNVYPNTDLTLTVSTDVGKTKSDTFAA